MNPATHDTRAGGPASARTAYDAIVVGAGHNGLVAAAYLARAVSGSSSSSGENASAASPTPSRSLPA